MHFNEEDMCVYFKSRSHKSKRSKRLKSTKTSQKRLKSITYYAGYPGPYIRDGETFARPCNRGKASRYLKRQCNHKVRRYRTNESFSNGSYKHISDFWWMLT